MRVLSGKLRGFNDEWLPGDGGCVMSRACGFVSRKKCIMRGAEELGDVQGREDAQFRLMNCEF